ncbi:MAG: hypothetical protein CMP23_05490 [Rickettsiales bacterium]|nr:hypothetical protein [Rickettsiales bacterium]|tara:strand:- start:26 stop:868 length:843 start_codon:yes stop_codon:yes gene_type:complete
MSETLSRLLLLVPTTLMLAACSVEPPPPLPEPSAELDLSASLGLVDPDVVGVSIDPITGQRYLLDRFAGIFELADDGSARLLRATDQFPVPEVLPQSLWTDFVAMGEGRFALTALSDGYLLDLEAETMIEYFCYEPEDMPFWEQQLTHSVTFDVEQGLIYAQPITFEQGSFEDPLALSSSVGAYSLDGGQPVAWFEMPEQDFLAHGAAVDLDGSLLLGRGNEIYRFDPEGLAERSLLGVIPGVELIEGLAVDAELGTLLVVDGARDRLVEVPLVAQPQGG